MDSPNRRMADERPRRLRKGLYILPSLFTTANLAAGFYAILQTALGAAYAMGYVNTQEGTPLRMAAMYFNHAALAIGFAVFFDGMDGAIARLTHTTSDFGKELDSLADVVTFGVAPGVLAWMWGFLCLPMTLDTDFRNKLIEFGAMIAFAFLTAGAVPFVDEKMFEGGEEEGAESAAVAVQAGEVIFLEEAGEEFLGEVLGIGAGMALAADVGVEGIPVGVAEFLQGAGRLRRTRLARCQDDGPMRRGENVARRTGLLAGMFGDH